MAFVKVDGDGSSKEALERALKKFLQKVAKEGTLKELKKREYYVSPAVKRRTKKNEARKRWLKNQKKKRMRDDYNDYLSKNKNQRKRRD